MVRQTARDAAVLEVLAQQYGLPQDVLASVLGVSLSRASGLVSRWKQAGWARAGQIDGGARWVWPSRVMARELLGWDPGPWMPRPGCVAHVRAVGALRLHRVGLDVGRWESHRALAHQAAEMARAAQAMRSVHVPDGVQVMRDGRRLLVQVELSLRARSVYLEPAPTDGRADWPQGLLADVASRARELECMGVVWWCPPQVVAPLEAVMSEFAARSSVRRARSGAVLPAGLRWAVKSLAEVPCWRPGPS
ncbi:hypothetical protein [Pseudonocardia sp. ICBG601]|uniref:hypothetical protein n=1 Tax=Pseudonocardia sp. ICBG601 TaxID=2846759 RepID=UPI0021F5D7AD|nr:hypothetical protein [Pseudonocardia sp. ICBG601]